MRFRAVVVCSMLAASLVWTGSALGQHSLADLAQRVDQLFRLLDHSIILTDQDCAIIGDNWKRYEALDGKMPLASGAHTDDREEERAFAVGQTGGAYRHELTVPEMPSHTHGGIYVNGTPDADHGDDEIVRLKIGRTAATGGSEPHENMPPYRVLNFCRRVGN